MWKTSLLGFAIAFVGVSARAADDFASQSLRELASVARTALQRRGARGQSSAGMGRIEEHQVEGIDSRREHRHAHRVGRQGVCRHRRADRQDRRAARRRSRGVRPIQNLQAEPLLSVRRDVPRPRDGQHAVAKSGHRRSAARRTSSRRQLCLGLAHHRWQAPLRVVRFARHLLLRHGGQRKVAPRPGRPPDYLHLRRRHLAGHLSRYW